VRRELREQLFAKRAELAQRRVAARSGMQPGLRSGPWFANLPRQYQRKGSPLVILPRLLAVQDFLRPAAIRSANPVHMGTAVNSMSGELKDHQRSSLTAPTVTAGQ
jgi:hypothetical protein